MNRHLLAAAALALLSGAVLAQTPAANTVQRDVNQQTRIEQGLQSGALSTKEAAKLEKEQARVDHLQARDLKDGKLSPTERAQLATAQNKASQDIAAAKHNEVTGNPQSASSQRMQADVQRNVNQQQRVENGLKDGSLTHREAAHLEKGEAKVARREATAGHDGHVDATEQARVQRAENRQSRKIHRQRHDAQERHPA